MSILGIFARPLAVIQLVIQTSHLLEKKVLSVLPDVEFVIADKGYYGDPNKILTPKKNDHSYTFNYQHK